MTEDNRTSHVCYLVHELSVCYQLKRVRKLINKIVAHMEDNNILFTHLPCGTAV